MTWPPIHPSKKLLPSRPNAHEWPSEGDCMRLWNTSIASTEEGTKSYSKVRRVGLTSAQHMRVKSVVGYD